MHPSPRHLVTEAEFLQIPESTGRIELVDGEVIVSPSPSYWHQEVLGRIVAALRQWAGAQARPIVVGQSPLDVRLGPARIVQPDAFVLLDVELPKDHQGPIEHVPQICIEVLSTDRAYDRVTKRFLYAAAGVAEYWVVEPAGLIERWSGDSLSRSEEVRGRLTSPLLPGLALDLDAVFV